MSTLGLKFHAGAKVDADAVAPAIIVANGMGGLVRTGIGIYTLTLDKPIDITQCLVMVSLYEHLADAGSGGMIIGTMTDDSTVLVETKNLDTADVVGGTGPNEQDLDFAVLIVEVTSSF